MHTTEKITCRMRALPTMLLLVESGPEKDYYIKYFLVRTAPGSKYLG